MMNTNFEAENPVALCDRCVPHRVQLAHHQRHWLLDAVYGRELLKQELRQLRPDLTVPTWREPEELEPLLDEIIDLLGVRAWRKPAGLKERLRYLRTVLQMLFAVRTGRAFPSW
jgi:hypothetical protein